MGKGHVQSIKREELTGEVALMLEAAERIGKRSRCVRRHVGAVGQSISNPARVYIAPNSIGCWGLLPCVHENLLPGTEKACRGTHAEISVLNQATAMKDGVIRIVVTTFPCRACAEALISRGLQELYYIEDYGLNQSFDLLLEEGVNIFQIV